MIIDRLQIHNFGPFYGDHEMEFDEDGRGVHLIRGGNGQGKTSIQRALIWGLYGRVVDRKGKDIRLTSLLNRRARRDDIYQFWVRIDFTHGGQEWTVIRKTEASVHSDKRYRDGIAVSLVRDGEPLPNPERELERILPYEVHRFFFFDGEMLRDYEELLEQSGRSTALLRNSIEKVLGIPYLRTARDDLYEVEKKFERERNSLVRRLGGRDFDQLVDDYQAISDEIDMRRGHIKELEQQIAELDGEIGDNKRRLADIESVRKLAEERLGIEQQMADLERRRDRETEKISKAVSQLHKTLLAAPAGSVIARLEREHQAVMQKYDRKQRYIGRAEELEEAIAANKCKLCGAVLNERELRRLEADLKEVHIRIKDLTEVPEPNLEFENHVNRLKRMVSEAPAREEFTDIEDRLTEINHEIAAEKARLAS
ncbi:MAG: AAA family ATPase, partial [Thermoplasmata archaeon]